MGTAKPTKKEDNVGKNNPNNSIFPEGYKDGKSEIQKKKREREVTELVFNLGRFSPFSPTMLGLFVTEQTQVQKYMSLRCSFPLL